MEVEKIIENGKCCGCTAPLAYSKSLNWVQINLKVAWEVPAWGNFDKKEELMGIGFICDRCLAAGSNAPKVDFVVEFKGDDIIYHPLKLIAESQELT